MSAEIAQATDLSSTAGVGMALSDLISDAVTDNAGTMIQPEEATAASSSEVAVETPTKKNKASTPRKSSGKKAKKENDDGAEEPTTPTALPKKKAIPKAKKGSVEVGENGDAADATPTTDTKPKSSGKKRGSKAAEGAEGAEETPTKKAKVDTKATNTTAKRVKAPATKFPESHAEFTEQDKLLYEQRKAGKGFDEIAPLWTAVTGTTPGKDVLRKRFAKLDAIGQEWAFADIVKMCATKREVETELAVALKKLENEKWGKIAQELKKAGGGEYKPAAVSAKYDQLVKKKLVDAKGVYIGSDDVVGAGPAIAVNGVVNGVTNGIKAASEDLEKLQVEEVANGEGEVMEED